MPSAFIPLGLILFSLSCPAPSVLIDASSKCLPAAIDLNLIVANEPSTADKQASSKNITVKTKLSQLKARCRKGKLVDGKGRQIRFVTLLGCWGNPPDNYLELLEKQEREIQQLKKRYTVIQIQCGRGSIDLRSINLSS